MDGWEWIIMLAAALLGVAGLWHAVAAGRRACKPRGLCQDRCPLCAYSLNGLETPVCPECGLDLDGPGRRIRRGWPCGR